MLDLGVCAFFTSLHFSLAILLSPPVLIAGMPVPTVAMYSPWEDTWEPQQNWAHGPVFALGSLLVGTRHVPHPCAIC